MTTPRLGAPARRGFWPLRDAPALVWLLAVPIVAVAHPALPAPRWLMVHLLLLGAVTHSILVWSRHFTDAVLHTPPGDRRAQSRRLLLLNAGVLLVVAGVPARLWPLVVSGASTVAVAVGWHGVSLVSSLRRALPARFGMTVRYYVAASAFLPVGALLGTLLARGPSEEMHARLMLAHATVNLLGWMGLTIVGTLVTLWPTMLRTRVAGGAEQAARLALPVLVAGVAVSAGGSLVGLRSLTALGLLAYLGGLGVLAGPFAAVTRAKPPASFPTWSVLAGLLWLVGTLGVLVVGTATAGSWHEAHELLGAVTPALAAGCAAQVLVGALSYLVPVALGGGPSAARAGNAVLDRGGALRIVMVNTALPVALLPVPASVRVAASGVVLAGLTSFLPLLVLAVRASRRARLAAVSPTPRAVGPVPVGGQRRRGQVAGPAMAGLAATVLAVAVGVALDPRALAGLGRDAAAGVAATGHTTTAVVRASDMRFTPSRIRVPAGDRLVIVVQNADDDVHDLVLDSGADTGRISGGDSARLVVGVIGRDIDGWCSVLGHRQMGMVLTIEKVGTTPAATHHHSTAGQETRGRSAGQGLDLRAAPPAGFVAHDATLPPLDGRRVHRRTMTVREVERAVAPGVTQRLWTYDGGAPGPVLHGRVGDRFDITLVNDARIGHSIDFHAGSLAPDGPMRTIGPGESLVYRFTATRAGIWMYHCSTMPMSAHVASGLFGAVVVEPRRLPTVDRSYLLVQSELYLGDPGGTLDADKLQAEAPDAVVFNGYVDQYDHRPLSARVGERVRIWVLDAGPSRPSSFHVVGGQFDTVYSEGAYLLRHGDGGSQALALAPAQGGFVELEFPEAGHYSFVTHVMIDAERGGHGIVEVTQ